MTNSLRLLSIITFVGIFGILGYSTVFASDPPPADEAGTSVSIRMYQVEGTLPIDDPNSPLWASVPESEFKLSPQVHWPERIQEVTVKLVKVKGLHDGQNVALLVEYEDPTEDPKDAAAVEFMVGDKKAHFAHGQKMLQVEGGPVNIWFWKKENGKALDMSAKGFKTLTTQEKQDVQATGSWSDGSWKVVFTRALKTEDEEDVQIEPGEWRSIAFAFWDGAVVDGLVKEKGSQKAVSSWWSIRAEPSADNSIFGWVIFGLALAAGFEFVVVRNLRKGQSA